MCWTLVNGSSCYENSWTKNVGNSSSKVINNVIFYLIFLNVDNILLAIVLVMKTRKTNYLTELLTTKNKLKKNTIKRIFDLMIFKQLIKHVLVALL